MPRFSGEYCRDVAEHAGLEYVEYDDAMSAAFGSPEAADSAYANDWTQAVAVYKKWLDESDTHHYSNVREDFYPQDGVADALRAGRSRIIMEDLS